LGLLAVSLTASVFLFPIIAFYFHHVSLISVPANLSVVPLMGFWVIPTGLLSVLFLPVSHLLADAFLHLSQWGLYVMTELIRYWSSFSFSSVWVVKPSLLEIGIFYGLILSIFFCGRYRWAKAGLICLAIALGADISYWVHSVRFNDDLRVTYLDVGQANAALVEYPRGKRMLIDGGGFARDHFDIGKMVIAPFLWGKKIATIDYLVLTHPQADHMNGLRFIARAFHPSEFWYNGAEVQQSSFQELMAIVESNGVTKVRPTDLSGVRMINGVRVEALHPRGDKQPEDHAENSAELNNRSLVLKLSYRGRSFLFPGDIEQQGEAELLSEAGDRIQSDVLLAAHHGSRTSNTEAFLGRVQPEVCIVSAGEGNYFGFPHPQTLERFEEAGCAVIRIDKKGAVECTVGKDGLRIKTFLDSSDRHVTGARYEEDLK
jgi:competence protein ComEC